MPAPISRNLKIALKKELQKNNSINSEVRMMLEKQFRDLHRKFMNDFLNHPVTRELKGGPSASNVSNSVPRGNLFGFIGFDSGADPISDIERSLEKINIFLKYRKFSNMGFTWSYTVSAPSARDLYKMTPMPWAKGSSWLRELEGAGIPNLGQYMHKKSSVSRSEVGIQNTKLSAGGRVKIPYVISLLNSFEHDLISIDASRVSKKYF